MNPQRINLLGVGVSVLNLPEAVRQVSHCLETNTKGYVCVTGVHGIMESQRNADLRAIHNHSLFTVPDGMLGRGNHFALEVEGLSMKDAGILDGDVVIIREANTARNNDIVVALVDQQEATLKRLRKSGDQVELIAENPDFETRTFGPDRVEVQGILVGLVRRYH